MGKASGMTIVAEGVETIGQETFLREQACDEMQGFLFSKPVPPWQLEDLLRAEVGGSPPLQPSRFHRHRVLPGIWPAHFDASPGAERKDGPIREPGVRGRAH